MTVKWMVGPAEQMASDLKVRALQVNGDTKEFTVGEPHDVTDRSFVVQRAVRVNDGLPDDKPQYPRWKWQPGGWLTVERANAHIAKLNLPEFDPYYSRAAWYRDHVAYCGVSDAGDKVFAVVMQIGRRKPVLHKLLGDLKPGELPQSQCAAPYWQRQPMRVTFLPAGSEEITFTVRTRAIEMPPEEDAEPSQ